MDFEETPLGEEFASVLKSKNETTIAVVLEKILAGYIGAEINVEILVQAVDMAKEYRSWPTALALSEAAVAHEDGGNVPAKLRRVKAQALIEMGALDGAECLLSTMSSEDLGRENREVAGLLARISKQRFVNFSNRRQLASAIRAYDNAYRLEDADRLWAGINLLALLNRAEQEKYPVPAGVTRKEEVRDELIAELDATPADFRDIWQRATYVELMVATGQTDDAVEVARSLPKAKKVSPFAIGSLRRQLLEIWRLPEDSDIVLALSEAEIGSGAGSEMVVPDVESLEKILSKEDTVPFAVYARGVDVAQEVCIIRDRYDYPVGTGFVLPGSELSESWGDELVLVTNAHVIPESIGTDEAKAVFTKMKSAAGGDAPAMADDLEILWSSRSNALDVTVLKFGSDSMARLDKPIQLAGKTPSLEQKDPFVYVIGHPAGKPLSMSIRGNELIDLDERKLHYMAPTEPGSSGSPVFDKEWNLVGVHRAGSKTTRRLDNPEERYPANEATNIFAVRDAIELARSAGGPPAGIVEFRVAASDQVDDEALAGMRAEFELDAAAVELKDEGLEAIDPMTVITVAVGTAEVAYKIWSWWRTRQEKPVQLTAVLSDGTEMQFNGLDEAQLRRFLANLMTDAESESG